MKAVQPAEVLSEVSMSDPGRFVRTAILGFLLILAGGCGGGTPASKTPAVPACTPSSTPEFAYVLNDGDNTISMFTVNSCTGALTPTTPSTVATGANAFGSEEMVVDRAGKFAYVANLMSNASDEATISMFTIDPTTGVLTPTTPATVGTGFFPQGIGIDPSGKFVYTANSDDNTVSMFSISANSGILARTTPPAVAAGWSPLSITVDPSGRFAYAANQDDGTVSMYTLDSTTGTLTPTAPAAVLAGESPFGVTIDPSGKFAYVPNAYSFDNSVSQYTVDSVTGVLTPNTPATVSAGSSPTSVAIDPSSKFAYVVNRQANSVSMFTIDSTSGNLTPNTPAAINTGGQPFRIVIDLSGKFAYVTNQSGNSVSIYTINKDGTLTVAGMAPTGIDPLSMSFAAPTR
jgi:6-phosphogluconolactonase